MNTDTDAYAMHIRTAQAVALTVNAPTGTPGNGQKLTYRIIDDGTTRTIAWNPIHRVIGTILPVATVALKTVYVECVYNVADVRWDVVAVNQEA